MIERPNYRPNPADKDEEILLKRAEELANRAEYSIVLSDFLSPGEQITFTAGACGRNAGFWGGAYSAERRVAVLVPQWFSDDKYVPVFSREGEEFSKSIISLSEDPEIRDAITPLLIKGSTYCNLAHRDYLGAMLALGLKRSVIGDIEVVDSSSARAFVLTRCADYIITNLVGIGRDTVRVSRLALPDGYTIEKKFTAVNGTVASARLDCIVSEIAKMSRSDASDAVNSGNVEVNYKTVLRVDYQVSEGDIVTVRGAGKFIIERFGSLNRRDRIRFEAKKYS